MPEIRWMQTGTNLTEVKPMTDLMPATVTRSIETNINLVTPIGIIWVSFVNTGLKNIAIRQEEGLFSPCSTHELLNLALQFPDSFQQLCNEIIKVQIQESNKKDC